MIKRWLAIAGVAAAAYAAVTLLAPSRPAAELSRSPSPSPAPSSSSFPLNTSKRELVSSFTPGRGKERRTYALPLAELGGLPSSAEPGLQFDLWVTWDETVASSPTVQRLLRNVLLVEIVPPITADAPAVAIISVRRAQTSALLYGDNFGRLSVAMRS